MLTSALSAMFVPGAAASVCSACIVCWSLAFSAGVRPSTCVPCSSAGFSTGSAASSDFVAGVMFCPNVVRSVSSGCWAASDWVETCSVDGDSLIVALRSGGLRSIAPNVVAIFPNSSALTCATGATAPMNEFSPSKNRVSSVLGSDR